MSDCLVFKFVFEGQRSGNEKGQQRAVSVGAEHRILEYQVERQSQNRSGLEDSSRSTSYAGHYGHYQ